MKTRFGFEINEARHVDLDRVDIRVYDELAAVDTSCRACINCGSCSASCPAGVSFRSALLRLSTLGELSAMETCLLCGKCFLVCPRGLSTRYVIIQIMKKRKEYGKAV